MQKIKSWFNRLNQMLMKKVDMELDKRKNTTLQLAVTPVAPPEGNGKLVFPIVQSYLGHQTKIFDNETYKRISEDFMGRCQWGKEKYGTYLRTNNGRGDEYGPLIDIYQEALDGLAYTTQAIMEEKNSNNRLVFMNMREHFLAVCFSCKLQIELIEKINLEGGNNDN